jgi:alpha-ribazole phosphatase
MLLYTRRASDPGAGMGDIDTISGRFRPCQHLDRTRAMRIGLIRHPKPLIAPGLCYGRLDIPPHPDVDIGAIAATLAGTKATTLWTSPALRCTVLADAIGAVTGLPPRADERLRELDFGAWEGQPWDAIPREALDAWAADPIGFAAPGGETGAALVARVVAFHRALGDTAIVVSHAGPLKLLAALLRCRPIDLFAPSPAMGVVDWVEEVR